LQKFGVVADIFLLVDAKVFDRVFVPLCRWWSNRDTVIVGIFHTCTMSVQMSAK